MITNHTQVREFHPRQAAYRIRIAQAKVGDMLMDIVRENPGKPSIEIVGTTELARKYKLGDKTFSKYLKKSIFTKEWSKHNEKVLFLNEMDVILIREFMYLENRYEKFPKKEKEVVKLLIESLWRTL